MKKAHLLSLTILFVIGLASWKFLAENYIQKVEWLIGTWENKTPRGSVFENWQKLDDNELFGRSYALNGIDTMFFEQVQLVQDGDSLFYIPTVINQNDGMPIQFALTSISDSSMVFEHPYHDFPQIIRYVRINKDSLEATVSGINNGEQREIVFPMRRVE